MARTIRHLDITETVDKVPADTTTVEGNDMLIMFVCSGDSAYKVGRCPGYRECPAELPVEVKRAVAEGVLDKVNGSIARYKVALQHIPVSVISNKKRGLCKYRHARGTEAGKGKLRLFRAGFVDCIRVDYNTVTDAGYISNIDIIAVICITEVAAIILIAGPCPVISGARVVPCTFNKCKGQGDGRIRALAFRQFDDDREVEQVRISDLNRRT